jgi:hypothetical protein
MSRSSEISNAAPGIIALERSLLASNSHDKSNLPPAERNPRVSAASCCCSAIHLRSEDGTSAATRSFPSGEFTYAESKSRNWSNSRTRDDECWSGDGTIFYDVSLNLFPDRAMADEDKPTEAESASPRMSETVSGQPTRLPHWCLFPLLCVQTAPLHSIIPEKVRLSYGDHKASQQRTGCRSAPARNSNPAPIFDLP